MADKIHRRVSINQLCFPGLAPSEFVAQADRIRARSVVLCSPALFNAKELNETRSALANTGISAECISHVFASARNLEDDNGEAQGQLLEVISAARHLGTPAIYLLTGGRGQLTWEQAAGRFGELIAPCLRAAEAAGISLSVENASPLFADIHIAHSLVDTLDLAERTGIGLCVDLFYCWAEAHVGDSLSLAAGRSVLVQLSDYKLGDRSLPARAVPGDGAVPIAALVNRLLNSGYGGVFDLELIGPHIDAEGHAAAITRAVNWLSKLLDQLGA